MQLFLFIAMIFLNYSQGVVRVDHETVTAIQDSPDSLFLDVILHDRRNNSFYLAININNPDYNGRAIIENVDLYYFLSRTQGIDFPEYTKTMKEILLRNDTLQLDQQSWESLGKRKFQRVQDYEEVQSYTQQGVHSFLEHFFDADNLLKSNIPNEMKPAIINQLFLWNIYISHQGVTGYLRYSQQAPPEEIYQRWLKVSKPEKE
jgi:hypothetical protein